MPTITVVPLTEHHDFLITALQPISHHDPVLQDDSNRTLFNRTRRVVAAIPGAFPTQEQIDAFCQAWPVPADLAPVIADLTFPEYVAATFVQVLLALYAGGEGTGLLSGTDRYVHLTDRLCQAAVIAQGSRVRPLVAVWDLLSDSLLLPPPPSSWDARLLSLWSLPLGLQYQSLRVLQEHTSSVVVLARAWNEARKLLSPAYAEKVGQAPLLEATIAPRFSVTDLVPAADERVVLDLPTLSANAVRNRLFRTPLWWHLVQTLNLPPVPVEVEDFFCAGGGIKAGAQEPGNVAELARQIRTTFPSVDLLGGNIAGANLRDSYLQLSVHLVCRENADVLEGTPAADLPEAKLSAFDLLDTVTLTRRGDDQMLFTFETVCAGTKFYLRTDLLPGCPELTRGAFACAVRLFLSDWQTVGGQAARGYGYIRVEHLASPPGWTTDLADAYETYLRDHRDQLVAWLLDRTLGTGKVVL